SRKSFHASVRLRRPKKCCVWSQGVMRGLDPRIQALSGPVWTPSQFSESQSGRIASPFSGTTFLDARIKSAHDGALVRRWLRRALLRDDRPFDTGKVAARGYDGEPCCF